jgi:hypothetical protein
MTSLEGFSALQAILCNIRAIALNTTENNVSYLAHELVEISRALRSAADIIDGEVNWRDTFGNTGRVA